MIDRPPTPLPPIDGADRCVDPGADLPELFRARATEAGLIVVRSTPESAAADIANLVRSLGARTIIREPGLPFTRFLEAAELDLEDGDEAMFAADLAITSVHSAVAETGSLVCSSGPGHWRGLSVIPPIHLAIVRYSQIVPDLVDLFAAAAPLPANLVLITGPSKTADIGGVLVTGVHGPRSVHVALVDDRGERSESIPQ